MGFNQGQQDNFGSGLASGATKGLNDFFIEPEKERQKSKLELQMLSKRIEMEYTSHLGLEAAKLAQQQRIDPAFASSLGKASGLSAPTSIEEGKMATGLAGNQIKASGSANRGGMSVSQFEKTSGVSTGYPPDMFLNKDQIQLYKTRMQSEKPTADTINSYRSMTEGLGLLDQLQILRDKAMAEVLTGPLAGRVANLAVAADQGANFPAAATYMAFRKGNLARIAKATGETRLTEEDVDRAAQLAPDFAVAKKASDMIFDEDRRVMMKNLAFSEHLFPGLRRMRENELGGQGLGSTAGPQPGVAGSEAQKPQDKPVSPYGPEAIAMERERRASLNNKGQGKK